MDRKAYRIAVEEWSRRISMVVADEADSTERTRALEEMFPQNQDAHHSDDPNATIEEREHERNAISDENDPGSQVVDFLLPFNNSEAGGAISTLSATTIRQSQAGGVQPDPHPPSVDENPYSD